MNHRRPIHPSSFIFHPLLLAILLAGCAKPTAHPNVLLITLDTFRADRVTARTPNLLKLAESGIDYTQADAAAPLTLPSHATILSGLLPLHHGIRNNGVGPFPKERPTLATVFAGAGYRTGAFVSSFVLDHRFGLNRGFETYDDDIARDPNNPNATLDAQRRGGETVDRALAWLRRSDPRPWFAWVHLYDAHTPYAPPPPYAQTYDGAVQYVDDQVGRLLGAIDRATTIVVVVGDHGESLGEHGELTHGLLLYESTLHVPLIVAGGERRSESAPISTAAVAPMIAHLAGLTMSGDDRIYAETDYPKSFGWSGLTSLRDGNRKVIRGTRAETFELPNESKPVETDRRLLAQLQQIEATAIAAGPSSVDEETRSKLASLGYIAPRNAKPSNEDARDMAPLFRRYQDAQAVNAIPQLQELVREDPSNPVFLSTLARAYRQAGALDRALPLYREAVTLSPADADAWYNLASALSDAGKAGEAKDVAAEAARLAPDRPEIHNVLGIALVGSGDVSAALSEFQKALVLDPRNARSYNNIGNIYRISGKLDAAEAAYRKALEIAPNYADALNGLGVIAVQRGDTKAAIDDFNAALKIAPSFYEARLNRAIAMRVGGDRKGASDELQQLLRDLPPGPAYDSQRTAARALLSR